MRPGTIPDNVWEAATLLVIIIKKFNLWLTAPKGTTPVNYTYATDWKMVVRRDVIAITLH